MRTFADSQRDHAERSYSPEADDTSQHDPFTVQGAKAILSSRGGKKAAQLAIAAIWEIQRRNPAAQTHGDDLPAPFGVLRALETLKLIEEPREAYGLAGCFRLTSVGMAQAAKAEGRA